MKKLDHTKLWEMLRNPTAASCPDVKAAFDEFIEEVSAYCRTEADLAERTRTLTLAKSEFRLHLEEQQNGMKKKCALTKSDQTDHLLH